MRKAPKIKRKGYQTGTPAAGVQELDENGNPIPQDNRNVGQKIQGSMGWLQYANAAQQAVRGANDQANLETFTDPNTGKTYTKYKDDKSMGIESIASPTHEKQLTNLKKGNYAGAIFGTDPVYGYLQQKQQAQEYDKAKANMEGQQAAQNALNAREQGQTMTTVNSDVPVNKGQNIFQKTESKILDNIKLAKGGEVKGKGGPKSDSINAEIEEGSFVVPAENNFVAKAIRKKVLGDDPNRKAKLHQGKSAVPVKLSNGEHEFTKQEKEKIEAELGEDFLKSLAPEAEEHEEIEGMKDGGDLSANKAREMMRDGTAHGHPLTDKQKSYLGWIIGGRKMADGTPNTITSKTPPNKTVKETKPVANKTVPTKKTYTKPVTNNPFVLKGENEPIPKVPGGTDANAIDVITPPTLKTSNADNLNSTQAEILNQSAQKGMAEYEAEKNKQSFWDKVNGTSLLDYGIGAAQAGIGLKNLQDKRPVYPEDKAFAANVQKAQNQAQYGFAPEQNYLIDQQNQNLLNQEIFAAKNFAGGSAANAYNMTRSATNNAFNRGLEKQVAGTQLQMDKQSNANNLLLQKNELNRQIFNDSMNAFLQKQQAGANLLSAGLNNTLSANRFQNFMKLREEENKFNNPYLNTGR